MREHSQHQLEEVQDWAAHLEHLQSILLEFDADCAPLEGQLGRIFYDGLRPSIKLWIDEVGRQQLPWDELVRTANRAEAKARIHDYHHLDQRCPKGKRPLKLTLKDSNEQSPEKTKTAPPQKAGGSSQSQRAEQGSEANRNEEKKSRRDKKHRRRQEQKEQKDNSGGTPATGANSSGGSKKKDLSHITCFNCDKKGHFASNCSEPPKNKSKN